MSSRKKGKGYTSTGMEMPDCSRNGPPSHIKNTEEALTAFVLDCGCPTMEKFHWRTKKGKIKEKKRGGGEAGGRGGERKGKKKREERRKKGEEREKREKKRRKRKKGKGEKRKRKKVLAPTPPKDALNISLTCILWVLFVGVGSGLGFGLFGFLTITV